MSRREEAEEEEQRDGGARGVRDEVLDESVENANVAERDAQPLEARLYRRGGRRVEHRERPRGARAARIRRARALRRVPSRALFLLRATTARIRRLRAGALRAAIRVPERQQRRETQLPAHC